MRRNAKIQIPKVKLSSMDVTFILDIIKKEIDGKIQAIHEYDNMLWKLRIGFLTLFFAGWGLLLQPFAEGKYNIVELNLILMVMTSITLVICLGGFLIDLNYVRRKFRVIHALDLLYGRIFSGEKPSDFNPEQFKDLIQISGSRADKNYLKSTGYSRELIVTCTFYLLFQW
jgi:hypothetical protein